MMVFKALALAPLFAASPALASFHHHGGYHHAGHSQHAGRASAGNVIQCVTFAKMASDISLSGNARDWWYNAQGTYARGARPEIGAVLAFRENGRMPLGHVAVVSGLADSRTIQIDQAHWNSRGITRDIVVKDVSENNDWTAVRVQLGRDDSYGAIYPTHGFIYARPDQGEMVANTSYAPPPALDQAPADLRNGSRHHGRHAVEVAEAPAPQPATAPAPVKLDLTVGDLLADAPERGLR
jgi:hypothetical protein